jgi:homocysteine S-methyltransferase
VWSCQISRRFPLNDSAAGREVIPSYYRDYLPEARAAGRSFLFATDSWRASSDWADRLDYDRALLKQNNATSAALCAELADEFAAAGVTSAIAGVIGPRRDVWQYDSGMTVAEALDYHSPQVEAFAGTAATSLHAHTLTNTPKAIGIARAAERARTAPHPLLYGRDRRGPARRQAAWHRYCRGR